MTNKQLKIFIGNRLKELRIKNNLRKIDVANILNLSYVSIINIESGRHLLKYCSLIKICELFKCTPNDIFPPISAKNYIIETKTINVKKTVKKIKLLK